MSNKEFFITALLLEYRHLQPYVSATIEVIIEYSHMYANLKNSSEFTLSESTVRRAIPKLIDANLIAEGVKNGLKKTYYLTEHGKRVLYESKRLKDMRLQELKKNTEELNHKSNSSRSDINVC